MFIKSCLIKTALLVLLSCFSLYINAQQVAIVGKVVDEQGLPLLGVNVVVKSVKTSTTTSESGLFSIVAQAGDVLVFSYADYQTQEFSLKDQVVNLTITMKPKSEKLGEVVVVGYGKQSRRTLSGSVSTLDSNILKSVSRSNAATALQGTITGLRVQQTSGQPGTDPVISFRGGTGFDGTGSPLVIIDGIIVPSLFGLNVDDIESMDLLKDAASTAIYGARAADGVILITTKKGKKGKSRVNYNFRHATNLVRRNPEKFLSAEDFIIWNRKGLAARYELALLDGNNTEIAAGPTRLTGAYGWATNSAWTASDGLFSTQLVSNNNRHLLNDVRWHLLVDKNPFNASYDSILFLSTTQQELEDMILQRSNVKDHYINFSGANDQGNFSLGIGALNETGMITGSSLKRMNMNFSGGLNVNKDFKVTVNISAYNAKTTPSYLSADNSGNTIGGLIQRFGVIAPTLRFTDDITGEILPGVDGSTRGNPAYFKDKFINITQRQRFTGGVNFEYALTSFLKLTGSATGYMQYTSNERFNKAYENGTNGAMITTRNASFSNTKVNQYSYNGFLQFDKLYKGHSLSALAGAEYYEYRVYQNSASANGAATDFIPYLAASTMAVGVPYSAFSEWNRLASVIGRVNYNYKSKYLLTANLRYDGTSRLADNKYGLFPGVSVGWNLQNEEFFKASFLSKYITSIKPRISWGQNGSISSLSDFGTTAVYSNVGIYNGNVGFSPTILVNSNLKWEKASTLNFGVDLGFWNGRTSIVADYFIRNVFDKIANLSVPVWTGYTQFTTNLGQLQNKGIEVELKVNVLKPAKKGGLKLDVSANVYHVKNYAVELPDNGLERNRQSTIQVWDPASGRLVQVGGLQEGMRIGLDEIWAPVYDGLYRTQEDIDKDASVYNTYLPHINKRLKGLGDARWRDVDMNDTIDFRDKVYVGRTTPTVQGGFSTQLQWKNFSFYSQFEYALGHMLLNHLILRGLSQVQGNQNMPEMIKDTWTPENPDAKLPRYYFANYTRNYFQDAAGSSTSFANLYEKGDYLCLRELTISYDFPTELLTRVMKSRRFNMKLSLTGSNLFYVTKYSGNFPEVGGNDVGRFALPRTITAGVNLIF